MVVADDSTPKRKRVSIPKEDESVLAWWALQRDPGLSVRQLIRAEIERGGYVDFVNRRHWRHTWSAARIVTALAAYACTGLIILRRSISRPLDGNSRGTT